MYFLVSFAEFDRQQDHLRCRDLRPQRDRVRQMSPRNDGGLPLHPTQHESVPGSQAFGQLLLGSCQGKEGIVQHLFRQKVYCFFFTEI